MVQDARGVEVPAVPRKLGARLQMQKSEPPLSLARPMRLDKAFRGTPAPKSKLPWS
ncbi:FlhC family transcriptional regulator [Salmonella enterica]|uniref:FlhC family transcriptional regulator n=1 Tax=Salmonella enterica TaxID=28901 RepID=UPI00398C6ECE